MAKPSGLPPRPKGERSIVKARFDGTRQRTRRSCAHPLEGTRQRTRRSCAHLQKIDTEKDAAGGSLQTLTTGSDSPLGNTWEQDQEQDACLPAYRPLENRTERQTVSSARREQGPRALLTKRSKALPNPRSVPGVSLFIVSIAPGVGSCLSAGGAPSATGEFGAPVPDHLPFGSSLTASLA